MWENDSIRFIYFRGNRRCAPREREVTRTDTEHKLVLHAEGVNEIASQEASVFLVRSRHDGEEKEPRWRFFLRFEFVQEEECEKKRDPRFIKGREATLSRISLGTG